MEDVKRQKDMSRRNTMQMMIRRVCDFVSRYMGMIVLVVALASIAHPEPLSRVDTLWINPLLGVVMFGMGLTLSPSDFRIVFSRPRDVLTGCLAQFTIMPLTAWVLTRLFHLPADLALGVILVGCCPGGTASNVITYLAKGDLALSVGMTAASTVLAPFLTPAITWLLAGTLVRVNALSMFFSILQVVILPILAGFVIQRCLPRFTRSVLAYLPAFSSATIVFIVGIIVSHNASQLLTCGVLAIVVVMLHNLCGLALGYGIGRVLRLQHSKCVAISIEVGMQNSGLATSLATLHFAAYPLAAIPGAVFSVWHNISGAVMAKVYGSLGAETENMNKHI